MTKNAKYFQDFHKNLPKNKVPVNNIAGKNKINCFSKKKDDY